MTEPTGDYSRASLTPIDAPLRPGIDVNRFRRRRFQLLLERLEALTGLGRPIRLLDIGGVVAYWEGLRPLWQHLPLDITIINLGAAERDEGLYKLREGNACSLPQYADGSFDLVHSNSVIEHVGHWPQMVAMAAETRRLAPHYFVQTPNFGFPIEPHFRAPIIHWLPEHWRARVLMRFRLGHTRPQRDFDQALRNVQEINLLSAVQMRWLFPDARLHRERFAGFTKSLIAIR